MSVKTYVAVMLSPNAYQ